MGCPDHDQIFKVRRLHNNFSGPLQFVFLLHPHPREIKRGKRQAGLWGWRWQRQRILSPPARAAEVTAIVRKYQQTCQESLHWWSHAAPLATPSRDTSRSASSPSGRSFPAICRALPAVVAGHAEYMSALWARCWGRHRGGGRGRGSQRRVGVFSIKSGKGLLRRGLAASGRMKRCPRSCHLVVGGPPIQCLLLLGRIGITCLLHPCPHICADIQDENRNSRFAVEGAAVLGFAPLSARPGRWCQTRRLLARIFRLEPFQNCPSSNGVGNSLARC